MSIFQNTSELLNKLYQNKNITLRVMTQLPEKVIHSSLNWNSHLLWALDQHDHLLKFPFKKTRRNTMSLFFFSFIYLFIYISHPKELKFDMNLFCSKGKPVVIYSISEPKQHGIFVVTVWTRVCLLKKLNHSHTNKGLFDCFSLAFLFAFMSSGL